MAQVSEQIKDIYGFEVSEGMVTAITNKLLPEIEAWQKRPLSAVYPIVYIDAIVFTRRGFQIFDLENLGLPKADCHAQIVDLCMAPRGRTT